MKTLLHFLCWVQALVWPATTLVAQTSLKAERRFKTQVKEPSDFCLNAQNTGFFIVSDNGYLAETDLDGKVLRQAEFTGTDFEAICRKGDSLYVVDERTREIHVFDVYSLKRVQTIEVAYPGGRNKGFESMCYNPQSQTWHMFTEKDPTWAFVLRQNFERLDKIRLKGFPDISSATFYEGKLWLLSDEAHRLYRLSPQDYSVEKYWDLAIINPEGICFSPSGKLFIASDDMGLIFQFDARPLLP